jgi:hypothetical protein
MFYYKPDCSENAFCSRRLCYSIDIPKKIEAKSRAGANDEKLQLLYKIWYFEF